MILAGLIASALAAAPVVVWDFADGDQGFVSGGDSGQWEHGVPPSGPGGSDALWATHLAGAYLNDTVDTLVFPELDLTGVVRPTLVLTHWYRILPGDLGWVEVKEGPTWTRIEPVYGYPAPLGFQGQSDFVDTTFDLSGFTGPTRLRLVFQADARFSDAGWYVAAAALWDGDVTAPRVIPTLQPVDTQELDEGYEVQAHITDDSGVDEVTLTWWAHGQKADAAMAPLGEGLYRALIPPQPPDTVVTWQILALDVEDNEATWPPDAPTGFRVFLAAPRDVHVEAADRQVSDRAVVRWSPPDSPHPVLGYVIQDADGLLPVLETDQTLAELQVGPDDPQRYRIAARYGAGLGDWSAEVDLGLEVPSLRSVAPPSAFQGETVHLRIAGSSLYLLEGRSVLDLGPGVDVLSLDVRDVSTLDAWVQVDETAPAGPRDLSLSGARGTFVFEAAFEVQDQAAGRRIVSITPDEVLQGGRAHMEVVANQPFAGPVTVVHGEGVLLLDDPTVDGERARFRLAVSPNAAVGLYTLILDDGARRLPVTFEVKQRVFQLTNRGCATAPVGGGLAWLLAWGLARRRRR